MRLFSVIFILAAILVSRPALAETRCDWPNFEDKDWEQTNGHYGYGCACMKVTSDPVDMAIKEIHSYRSKPLAVCREDPALEEPAYQE